MSVHANNSETNALVKVVVESNTLGKVGAAVQSARALVVIDCGTSEGVLEDPVGAGVWSLETGNGTITSRVDAIFMEQVDHGNDASDVHAWEVTDAPSIIRWGLELRELILGDLSLADGVVVVTVLVGEDVDVRVVIIPIVTSVFAKWASEDGGGEREDGESGDS